MLTSLKTLSLACKYVLRRSKLNFAGLWKCKSEIYQQIQPKEQLTKMEPFV